MAETKHGDIAQRLTQEILLGQYRTGERLASERDLAARFSVNRGAVREAMQRLKQLGIVRIEPGGARVAPVEEASLDVIGHLLALGELPEGHLVEQILSVVTSLITLAAETAVVDAPDSDVERIQNLVEPLCSPELEGVAHGQARLNLMQAIMEASGNLPCQLIARSLLLQLVPRMSAIEPYVVTDYPLYRRTAQRLRDALNLRDVAGVRAAFEAFAELNQDTVRRALALAEQSLGNPKESISISDSAANNERF